MEKDAYWRACREFESMMKNIPGMLQELYKGTLESGYSFPGCSSPAGSPYGYFITKKVPRKILDWEIPLKKNELILFIKEPFGPGSDNDNVVKVLECDGLARAKIEPMLEAFAQKNDYKVVWLNDTHAG